MSNTNDNRSAAVEAFALASLDAEQSADLSLARIAHAVCTHKGAQAFADDVSAVRATQGLARQGITADTFKPTQAVPTWEAFVEAAAGKKPYAVSASNVRNLVNGRSIILAGGIDEADPVAFANAKRVAVTWGASSAAKATEALAGQADPAATLATLANGRTVAQVEADAKAAAKKDAAADLDPSTRDLLRLLRRAGAMVQADGSDLVVSAGATVADLRAMEALLTRFAAFAGRGAELVAGGAAVLDATGATVADGRGDN